MNRTRPSLVGLAALALIALTTTGCQSDRPAAERTPAPIGTASFTVDLRVDANQDGRVDTERNSDTDETNTAVDAVFLPNLDDDGARCRSVKQPRCNDASDKVVNGAADAEDLAPITALPVPGISPDATGTIKLTSGAKHARLFVKSGNSWKAAKTLTADQLRSGVEFGLEGRDFLRDPAQWDGRVEVTLSVTDQGQVAEDRVQLKVAPLITTNHTMPLQQVFLTDPDNTTPQSKTFATNVTAATTAVGTPQGTRQLGLPYATFPQDLTEQTYATMPRAGAPDGVQSLSLYLSTDTPDRVNPILLRLRAPGVGVAPLGIGTKDGKGSFSFGNLETLPPYSHDGTDHPFGRIVIGRDSRTTSVAGRDAMVRFFQAQGLQDPLVLDVGHLTVGHIDEVLQVLPADNERGWTLAVADTRAGLEVVRRAQRSGLGKSSVSPRFEKMSGMSFKVDEVLAAKSGIVAANERAAAIQDTNIATLTAETGISADELVRVPTLLRTIPKEGDNIVRMTALVPAAINSLLLTPDTVLAAQQFSIDDHGRDLFADAVEQAYASAGVKVRWIDDFETHHVASGDVHCGTNTLRLVPGAR